MDLITQERDKYADVWTLEAYGTHSPGERNLPVFLSMVGPTGSTVLDAGCGSGKGALALSDRGFDVECCDFTVDGLVEAAKRFPFHQVCLWNDVRLALGTKFDYVYCCDVLEHIPVALTMLVVSRLLDVCTRGAFFTISFQPDVMGYWVGRPLHETVMPFIWWRDQLAAVGELVEARDMLTNGAFFVRPR